MSRTLKKIAFGLTAMLVFASGIGYLMRAELSARYTAYQLRSTNDESTAKRYGAALIASFNLMTLLISRTPAASVAAFSRTAIGSLASE